MDKTALLKGLNSQIDTLDSKITSLTSQISLMQKETESLGKRKKQLQGEVANLSRNGELVLTEHAIIRYLQRVDGLNLDDIRSRVITDKLKAEHKVLGNGQYSVSGFSVKIKENCVISVFK